MQNNRAERYDDFEEDDQHASRRMSKVNYSRRKLEDYFDEQRLKNHLREDYDYDLDS